MTVMVAFSDTSTQNVGSRHPTYYIDKLMEPLNYLPIVLQFD